MTSTTPEENAPPALFEHCRRTYAAMLAESRAIETFTDRDSSTDPQSEDHSVDPDEDTTSFHFIVYEGFLTQLITGKLNLSVPYYTSVRKALIRMGCIRQLKRGGGNAPSQWEMIYEPTYEAFQKAAEPKTPKQTKESQMQETLDSLVRRQSEIEDTMDAILEALAKNFGTEEVQEANG